MSDNQSAQQPSLVGGHVQYAKGAVETAIGDVTGSESWKASGQQDKEAGVAAMRKADEKRDPAQGYGKVEEVAGKWTGCEGMKKESAESSRQKNE